MNRPVGLVVFMIAVVGGAGMGFAYKFAELTRSAISDDIGSFAVVPLTIYVTMAFAFTCLLIAAFIRGDYRDVEAPKHRMLEQEEEYRRTGQ